MRCVLTLFDYTKNPPLPLQSISIDNDCIQKYLFFLPGTGLTLKQIYLNILEFRKQFTQYADEIAINDFKTHLMAFGLERRTSYQIYDLVLPPLKFRPRDEKHGIILLAQIYKSLEISAKRWQRLLAKASVVYQHLEDKGVCDVYKPLPVAYSLQTFTGRSKTTGFNLQGATQVHDIKPRNQAYDYLIHFDWLAADLRMASYLSDDQDMILSFQKDDPYITLVKHFKKKYDRDQCKHRWLRTVYSLSTEDPILDAFPTFREWMREKIVLMREQGYLESILGRKFYIEGDNELAVFNAQFQGSVAHAMQAALVRIFDKYPDNLVTEMHDSIILCCLERNLQETIKQVVRIMLDPLADWMTAAPRMPVRVNVGIRWREWQLFKIYH